MRVNKYVASASELSRRGADEALKRGRIEVNGKTAELGVEINPGDTVTLDGKILVQPKTRQLLILNKPSGYVCSKNGQGSRTVYELLPHDLQGLKTVGRLDKDSTGLILLTDDGDYTQSLTHPSNKKHKIYLVELDHDLEEIAEKTIAQTGVLLEDGPSQLSLGLLDPNRKKWKITMTEGRNRQIRRTFEAVGRKVNKLHRIKFGDYELGDLKSGEYKKVDFL